MTTRVDDRNDEQKNTHRWLVTATDKAMSGWGGARRGLSKCAWACQTLAEAKQVYAWVKSRSEMKYVNITGRKWYPSAAHVHIYVVDATHPSLTAN